MLTVPVPGSRLRDPSRRRKRDAAARLERALAARDGARAGWEATDPAVQAGFRRWIAAGWTGRERRLRAEATATAAGSGPLRFRPGPGWGEALGRSLMDGLSG